MIHKSLKTKKATKLGLAANTTTIWETYLSLNNRHKKTRTKEFGFSDAALLSLPEIVYIMRAQLQLF